MGLFDFLKKPILKPSELITDEDRAWVEETFEWLAERFGIDTLKNRAIITPTKNFFPKPYENTIEEIADLLRSVCGWMKIDPERVDLQFYYEENPPTLDSSGFGPEKSSRSAGLYVPADDSKGGFILALEERTPEDPVVLVSTIAHELAHAHLLGGEFFTGEEEHHEPVTDLLAIYLGLGIFIANSAFQYEMVDEGGSYRWSNKTHGYLPEQLIAYALACYSWVRGETRPEWQRFLDYNVQFYFKKCLKTIAYRPSETLTKLRDGA